MELHPNPRQRTLSQIGCIVWGIVALAVMAVAVGLLLYIDLRFGAESSAFFIGLMVGIPFLLLVALIIGGIYVLIVKGTTHMQEKDDAGEIERMRALREVARHDRLLQQQNRGTQPTQRLLDAWQQQEPLRRPWPEQGDEDEPSSGSSYRILE